MPSVVNSPSSMVESGITGDIDQKLPESQPHTSSKHDRGWRNTVRNFTPAYVSTNDYY